MTTAARPTFEPARGGSGRNEKDLSAISRQYSSRDLPGHTKLKYREHGQGTQEETRSRDFRRELEEREVPKSRPSRAAENKRLKLDQASAASLDADDPVDHEDDSDSSEEEEDDTEALLAELNKIKKERAIEQTKKEIEKRQEEERIRMENILSGNPLLTHYSAGGPKGTDHKVKRRWDDDVVFKNCAKSEPEKKNNVFINDSLRSDFHKKFMEKYVK
ncbi:unnamed protein product [Ceutorhynchus assimilis]|uniref:Spliceosome-associated protein CWC15 homolog n=1 Tax=Ceutorhynchus assimilis TaxID=467358 RepID=A0A9N9MX59_9CUCU|nr:unnamed protein product [Ceutorhynchus assimilis]